MLIGQRTPRIEVSCVVTGHNVHPQPHHHFLLDAASLLRADAIANARQQTIIGFYHSHPDATAVPSLHDRHENWPNSIMLIVASDHMRPRYFCTWLVRDYQLIPEPVQVIRQG